jgi:hypothetical protein
VPRSSTAMIRFMNMRDPQPYEKFVDLMFQEIQDRDKIATRRAVEAFVGYAATKGFSLGHLIKMSKSGMSGAQIRFAVDGN